MIQQPILVSYSQTARLPDVQLWLILDRLSADSFILNKKECQQKFLFVHNVIITSFSR